MNDIEREEKRQSVLNELREKIEYEEKEVVNLTKYLEHDDIFEIFKRAVYKFGMPKTSHIG